MHVGVTLGLNPFASLYLSLGDRIMDPNGLGFLVEDTRRFELKVSLETGECFYNVRRAVRMVWELI